MGIFSRFNKTKNIELSKSDFVKETDESETEITFISEEFAKSLAEYKKKQGISETKSEIGKVASVTSFSNIRLLGNNIRIEYSPNELEIEEDVFISQINKILNWIPTNIELINDGIIDKLLSLKNEDWSEENVQPLSKEQFKKRLKLESILFFHDGSSQLGFDDGDLFFGHRILVDLSDDFKFVNADLFG